MGLSSEPHIALHVANMALRLSDKTTIYTNGSGDTEAKLRAALLKPTSKIDIDARAITNVRMLSKDGSDVVITFEDGSTKTEGFIVSRPPSLPTARLEYYTVLTENFS